MKDDGVEPSRLSTPCEPPGPLLDKASNALGGILRRQRADRALAAEAALTGDLLDE